MCEYTIHSVQEGKDKIVAMHVKEANVPDVIKLHEYKDHVVYAMPNTPITKKGI